MLHRFTNVVQITGSYAISLLTGRVFHAGSPLAVSIEPTNLCNLRCPECPSGLRELTRARGLMRMEGFTKTIDQLLPDLSYLTLYFQGEPYMNPLFFDMVRYARSKKVFVTTSTNGHFLNEAHARKTVESGLNTLIVSLDGTDQQAYEQYRIGGKFDTVIAGITALVKAKRTLRVKHPRIILQFLVLKSNQHQIKEIKRLGKALGVDKVELKSAQFYDYENGNPLMPDISEYSRYRAVSGDTSSPEFIPKNSMPNRCFRMWSSCVVTWDLKVVPCCYDKDANHEMGDLSVHTFHEIWRGELYNKFRKKILSNRKSVEMCKNCLQQV